MIGTIHMGQWLLSLDSCEFIFDEDTSSIAIRFILPIFDEITIEMENPILMDESHEWELKYIGICAKGINVDANSQIFFSTNLTDWDWSINNNLYFALSDRDPSHECFDALIDFDIWLNQIPLTKNTDYEFLNSIENDNSMNMLQEICKKERKLILPFFN